MLKQTKYNIAETNIALLGSDLEKKVKEAAAKTEKQWEGAGTTPGLLVWRIEKFCVVPWPKEQYSSFFTDDSYIVLHTYKRKGTDALAWDVHFWLGQTTSQDEAGTAAYKTVELDDVLGGAPVQHREVQGAESTSFLQLFESYGGVKYMEGGIESGFRHVEAAAYSARLLHVKGKRGAVRVLQVPPKVESLNAGDAFLLDQGLTVYQWHGKSAGIFEKQRAAQIARSLDDERGSKVSIVVVDQGAGDGDEEAFMKALGGSAASAIASAEDGGADADAKPVKKLFRLSDAGGGQPKFSAVAEGGDVKRSSLDSSDVFVLDVGSEVFAWVGKAASKQEKRNALGSAQSYLVSQAGRAHNIAITRVMEGGENEAFEASF